MALDPDVVALSYNNLIFKFGRTPVIAVPSVVWDGATAAYPGWLAAEAACELLSASADDDTGQGGATEVVVVGQGNDGLEISETVITNGVGVVALANDYQIIYRAYCPDGEEDDPLLGANHGLITIRRTAGPVIMAQIQPLFGQTQMALYRIPSNKYGELTDASFFGNEGKGIVVQIKTRKNRTDARGWRARLTMDGFQNHIKQDLEKEPIFLYPGEDIVAIASSAPAGTLVSGHFSIRLYDLVQVGD